MPPSSQRNRCLGAAPTVRRLVYQPLQYANLGRRHPVGWLDVHRRDHPDLLDQDSEEFFGQTRLGARQNVSQRLAEAPGHETDVNLALGWLSGRLLRQHCLDGGKLGL